MNVSAILTILSWVIGLQGIFLLLPGLIGFCYGETRHAVIYLLVAAGCLFVGTLLRLLFKTKRTTFYARDGFVAVALSWIVMSLIGSLPLFFSGDIPSFTDALFEIISGYTTTGSSILSDVEALSHCNLFFRSFSHWIGGMGVLVFILAILPMTGGSTMNLMKAESPGPSVGKLVPKIQQTALLLYAIYLVMTVVEFLLLFAFGMPLFEALCHAVATAGTGGFGIKNDSIAGYAPQLQIILTVFMLLFGVNFTFYYYLLIRRVKDAFRLEEVRWYLLLYLGAVVLLTVSLRRSGVPLGQSLREVTFQVASIITTTGYATTDYNLWPEFSRCLIAVLMFTGACAGSTSGGIKISRIMLYVKQAGRELKQQIHPRQVHVIRMDKKAVPHSIVRSCNVLLMAYILVFIGSLLLISLDGFDLTTSFTAVSAALNNIGPGLNQVGPTGNFSGFSVLSKYVLMFDMLAGRLEIIPMLILFHPATWRR